MAESEAENHEKQTITGLAKRLSRLPADKRRAAVEAGAGLAGVSLRVSRDFAEAVPSAAKVLSAEEIRAWGEYGRKLAMGSAETGSRFFAGGIGGLANIPPDARHYVFEICTRQLVLSSSISLSTFDFLSELAEQVGDAEFLTDIMRLASDVASRSAKHSADFLKQSPAVARALKGLGRPDAADDKMSGAVPTAPLREAASAIVSLASHFANRTGGMTADLWSNLPKALEGLQEDEAVVLAARAAEFLEHGGSVTLHFVSAGGAVLRSDPEIIDDWCRVLSKIAKSGNAVLIAFLRATPIFFKQIGRVKLDGPQTLAIRRLLNSMVQIAEYDAESALAAFRSSASALRYVSLDQYEEWIEAGLEKMHGESTKARRGYFALETRQSNDQLRITRSGLQLESVQHVLRLYIEALTGREIEIAPQTAAPRDARIGDGKMIYLPSSIAEFDTEEMDFRIYKVLAAHGAGQIEFGTFAKDTSELKAIFAELKEVYSETAEQRDAFSLAGYMEEVQKGEKALPEGESPRKNEIGYKLPADSDYRTVLRVFPEPRLAGKIFGTMENARIDSCLRAAYRGLRKDLDLMRDFLKKSRPYIFDVPAHLVPFELLFQITLCGGATEDARQFYGPVVSEIETIVDQYLALNGDAKPAHPDYSEGAGLTTVADALFATSRVYNLFQNISPEQSQESEPETKDQQGEFAYDDRKAEESVSEDRIKREERPKSAIDLRELFSAWNSDDDEGEPDDIDGSEAWSWTEMPEQPLETGDEAFSYDEWDRELNDYRVGWSRVIEKKVKEGDRNFVELARSRYRGVISSVRHQFQLMKPENLTKINHEIDGEDYDLSSLVDFVIDRRADGRQSENIYTKRLRRRRDVAVSLLLDQSSSTARTITRNPLQPYTFPGRRIIEIEKEGLVLMSEALEAVGDVYSINGFTSEGRRNVKFYVVKDFDEKYSDEIEKRIGGITFQNNTRLGAAIRHAAAKLLRQDNRTKLMIILTDGRPYDHDYGDARYAREDVREALLEAKISGIIPFCITIDRESEAELKDLYGDVGYTIIDDVLSLPERMPNIYRRLTS